jgi:hypothetical protein
MASKNRLLPVWGLHLGYTRGGVYTWVGKEYFSLPEAKKNFFFLKVSNLVC